MCSLPIVAINGDEFEINMENFDKVLDKVPDCPIVTVSINGCAREGKSYALSYVVRYFKEQGKPDWFQPILPTNEAFAWRSGPARETVGINIWSEPFIIQREGRDVAVLLLDSQGFFDSQTCYSQNPAIYALSSLLSSVVIYNVKSKMEEDLPQKMHLFAQYTDCISQQGGFRRQPGNKPSLMLLIRDFEFEQQFPLGFHSRDTPAEQGSNYFQQTFSNVGDKHKKNLEVRKFIQKSYEDIGMFLLPHPGRKFTQDSGKYPPDVDFQESLADFVEHMSTNLVTKKIGNEEMTGGSLKAHVKLWADLCKNGSFPPAETIAEITTAAQNGRASKKALEFFLSEMGKAGVTFEDRYEPLLQEAIEMYKSASMGNDDVIEMHVSELTEVCQSYFKTLQKKIREIKAQKMEAQEEQRNIHEVFCTTLEAVAPFVAVIAALQRMRTLYMNVTDPGITTKV